MSNPPIPTLYTRRFIRETKAFRNWLDENIAPGKGRAFILELDEFICQKSDPLHGVALEANFEQNL